MRTSSLWGRPPTRFYSLLRQVKASTIPPRSLNIAILGCSDGKFVLPAARKGHRVLAVDMDKVALLGGTKAGPQGPVRMAGLRKRTEIEAVGSNVTIICADFVSLRPHSIFDLTFSSGAIQYSYNLRHDIRTIVDGIQAYVRQGGFIYLDYMHPITVDQAARQSFLTKQAVDAFFPSTHWTILFHRLMAAATERGHVDNPRDHLHRWGHILVRRIR